MPEVTLGLIFSAFIAGLLMFLAPCTLPLVPAFLAFITGVKGSDVTGINAKQESVRKIRRYAVCFVLGFSLVFIMFGVLAGFAGSFVGQFRDSLSQVGGFFIILFALMMLGILQIKPLMKGYTVPMPETIKPGSALGAGLIGVTFALGWTPCIGPVLASVLLLATTSYTAFSGGFLLAIFSLGLAVPFLTVAFLYGQSQNVIDRYSWLSQGISIVGGLFLLLIGILLLTNNFGLTVEYGYKIFNFFGFDGLFKFL